jgi:hypothetical protein
MARCVKEIKEAVTSLSTIIQGAVRRPNETIERSAYGFCMHCRGKNVPTYSSDKPKVYVTCMRRPRGVPAACARVILEDARMLCIRARAEGSMLSFLH